MSARCLPLRQAKENAPIRYADDEHPFGEALIVDEGILYRSTPYGDLTGELSGECQPKNAATILVAVDELRKNGMAYHQSRRKERLCPMYVPLPG